ILFSGGTDSLAGAVQEAIIAKRQVALIYHRSSPKIAHRQTRFRRVMPNSSVAKKTLARIDESIAMGPWPDLKSELERTNQKAWNPTVKEFSQTYLEEYCRTLVRFRMLPEPERSLPVLSEEEIETCSGGGIRPGFGHRRPG